MKTSQMTGINAIVWRKTPVMTRIVLFDNEIQNVLMEKAESFQKQFRCCHLCSSLPIFLDLITKNLDIQRLFSNENERKKYAHFICFTIVLFPDSPAPEHKNNSRVRPVIYSQNYCINQLWTRGVSEEFTSYRALHTDAMGQNYNICHSKSNDEWI